MNAIYGRQRHIYDVTRKWYLLGRDRMIERLGVPPGGTVLEIGCGTGRNLIAVARHYPTARLYGLDISEEMLATARASVARAGLSDRIVLMQGDATDFDAQALFGMPQLDRVFFSYTLSMIPNWQGALAQGARVCGGAMHLVDFGQCERLPGWFGQALIAWLAKFHVAPREPLFSFLTQEFADDFGRIDCRPLFRGYAWSGELSR